MAASPAGRFDVMIEMLYGFMQTWQWWLSVIVLSVFVFTLIQVVKALID